MICLDVVELERVSLITNDHLALIKLQHETEVKEFEDKINLSYF